MASGDAEATRRAPEPAEAWRDWGLRIFLLVAAWANFAALKNYVFEDAYITYRYAANLAAGQGFVFQAGEKVLGTSAPLLTLLLALCRPLGIGIPQAGSAIYALSLSACAFLGAELLTKWRHPNAGIVFAVLVTFGVGGTLVFWGMETSLHLALIFLAFNLAGEKYPWTTGIVLGLICLNRYDGVIAVAAVLLCRFLATRRLPWREALVCSALFGGWLLFAQLYFGAFLPNTYAAKAADVPFGEYALGSLQIQAKQFFQPFQLLEPHFLWPVFWLTALILLLLPLPLYLFRLVRLQGWPELEKRAAPISFALLLWLGYATIGPPLGHTWYLVPASLSVLALSLASWGELTVPPRLATFLALALLLVSLPLLPWAVRKEAAVMTSEAFGQDRIDAYTQMADFILEHHLEDSTIQTLEPGYLTFLTGQKVIDAAGLVTPGVFFHGPEERRSGFFKLLIARRPEMVVTQSPRPNFQALEHWYQLVLTPVPSYHLWLRKDFYGRHLPELFAAWQRRAQGKERDSRFAPPQEPGLAHPIVIDFEDHPAPLLFLRRSQIRRNPALTLAGQPYRRKLLQPLDRPRSAAAWSQPFEIDFDLLEFLFKGCGNNEAVAQLYVGDHLAYEVQGPSPPEDPGASALAKITFPLSGWQGQKGRLAFVSNNGRTCNFAVDHIRSRRVERFHMVDDFESSSYSSEVWAETFDLKPIDTRRLAELGGLQMAQGSYAATSLFGSGKKLMRSRPFLLDYQRLSFTVLDFGDERTRVELQVNGESAFSYTGSSRRRLDGVTWDLAEVQGQEGILILRDDAEEAEIGIAIDTILLYDVPGPLAAD